MPESCLLMEQDVRVKVAEYSLQSRDSVIE